MVIRNCAALWAFAALALSCAQPDAAPNVTVVDRDSAGVRIVELDSGVELPEWTVLEPPLIQIGAEEGDTTFLFDQIRAAYRFTDGRIVVADGRLFGGQLRLQYFDSTGAHLRSVGRRGRGPGEFQDFTSIVLRGTDSLVVIDWRSRRLTIYTGTGENPETRPITAVHDARPPRSATSQLVGPAFLGVVNDGRILVSYRRSEGGSAGAYSRDTLFLYATSGVPGGIDTFPRVPGHEYVVGQRNMSRTRLPFSYQPVVLPWTDGVLTGSSEQFELRKYDLEGQLTMIIRQPSAGLALTDKHRERYLTSGSRSWRTDPLRVMGSVLPSPEQQIDLLPPGHGVPAYAGTLADDRGNLWIRHFDVLEHQQQFSAWTILDSSGRPIARAKLPQDAKILHLSGDHIVSVVRDDLGVEYVRVYTIVRS